VRLGIHRGGNHYSPWEAILTSVDTNWDGKYEYESKGDPGGAAQARAYSSTPCLRHASLAPSSA